MKLVHRTIPLIVEQLPNTTITPIDWQELLRNTPIYEHPALYRQRLHLHKAKQVIKAMRKAGQKNSCNDRKGRNISI